MCGHVRSILLLLLAHCGGFCSGFVGETKGVDEKPAGGTFKLPTFSRYDGQPSFQGQTAQSGPQYQCGDRAFTVMIKQEDSSNIKVKETTGNLLFLVQLSSACGYSTKTTRTDVLLLFNFDSCYVKKEDSAYRLPINWYGTDNVLNCPVKKPAPTVVCKNNGMELTVADGALDDLLVSLNGQPTPLLYASSKCWQRLESNQGEVSFFVPYAACGVGYKDGRSVLDLKSKEESFALSCPSNPRFPSPESRPVLKPGFYQEVPNAFPSRALLGRYPLDPVDGVSSVPFLQPKPRWTSRTPSFPSLFNMSVNIPFAIPAPVNTFNRDPTFGGRDLVSGNINPLSGGAVQLYGKMDPFSGATVQLSGGANPLSGGTLQRPEETDPLSGGTWQLSRGHDRQPGVRDGFFVGRNPPSRVRDGDFVGHDLPFGVRDGLFGGRHPPSRVRDGVFLGRDPPSRVRDGVFLGRDPSGVRTGGVAGRYPLSGVRDGVFLGRDPPGVRDGGFADRDPLSGVSDGVPLGQDPLSGVRDDFFASRDPPSGVRDGLFDRRDHFSGFRDNHFGSRKRLSGVRDFQGSRDPLSGDGDRDLLLGDKQRFLDGRDRLYGRDPLEGGSTLSGDRAYWLENRNRLSGNRGRWVDNSDYLSGNVARQFEGQDHLSEDEEHLFDTSDLSDSAVYASGARDRQDLFGAQDGLSGSSKRWFGDRSSLYGNAGSLSASKGLSERTGSSVNQKLFWISQLLPPGYVISTSNSQSPRALPQTSQSPEPTSFPQKDLEPDENPSEPDTDSDPEEVLTPRSMNPGRSVKNMPSEDRRSHVYQAPLHPVKESHFPHSQHSSVWLRVTPQGSQ